MRTDDPNVTSSALIGLIGAVLLFVIIVWLQAYFVAAQRQEVLRKNAARPPQELVTLRARQMEKLHGYRWVDRERGIVAIPIERAMELLAQESGGARRGSEG